MTFSEVMDELDYFTAPPKDGDYDRHIHDAMKAVYDLVTEACP